MWWRCRYWQREPPSPRSLVHWQTGLSGVRVRWRRELISWRRVHLWGCWTGLAAPWLCCLLWPRSPAGTAGPAAGWWPAHAQFAPGTPSNNPGTKRVRRCYTCTLALRLSLCGNAFKTGQPVTHRPNHMVVLFFFFFAKSVTTQHCMVNKHS